jgi:hypothetical protein
MEAVNLKTAIGRRTVLAMMPDVASGDEQGRVKTWE